MTVSAPTAAQAAAAALQKTVDEYGQHLTKLIEACTPPGMSLDIECTIRCGRVRLRLTMLHKGTDWQDRSGG